MTPGANSTHGIPGNCVGYALSYFTVAVRADPQFVLISICPDCALHLIFDTAANLGSFDPGSQNIEV